MNCDRCRHPVGYLSFTVEVWAGDDQVAHATLCTVCGGFLTAPMFMPTLYPELEKGAP